MGQSHQVHPSFLLTNATASSSVSSTPSSLPATTWVILYGNDLKCEMDDDGSM